MFDSTIQTVIVLSHMYPKTGQPYSGAFVHELVKALSASGDSRIIVISPVPYLPKYFEHFRRWHKFAHLPQESEIDGIQIYYPRYFVLPGKHFFPFLSYSIYSAVKRLIEKHPEWLSKSTIIHAHTLLPDGGASEMLARKLGIRQICTLHGSDINIYPFQTRLTYILSKRILARGSHFITVSDKIAQRAISIESSTNTVTIFNGADHKLFYPRDKKSCRKALSLKKDALYILFIGNLIPIKGVDILLNAFAQIPGDHIHLLIAGSGHERSRYEAMTSLLGLSSRVTFVGRIDHDLVPIWLSAADIFVLPSRSEGFPTVIPEAMMCGIPIVATDVGGVAEAVDNGRTGLLIQSEDIDSLASALKKLIENEHIRRSLSVTALEFSSKLTWQSIAEQTVEVYNEVLSCPLKSAI